LGLLAAWLYTRRVHWAATSLVGTLALASILPECHSRRTTKRDAPTFRCETCGVVRPSRNSLFAHLRDTHTKTGATPLADTDTPATTLKKKPKAEKEPKVSKAPEKAAFLSTVATALEGMASHLTRSERFKIAVAKWDQGWGDRPLPDVEAALRSEFSAPDGDAPPPIVAMGDTDTDTRGHGEKKPVCPHIVRRTGHLSCDTCRVTVGGGQAVLDLVARTQPDAVFLDFDDTLWRQSKPDEHLAQLIRDHPNVQIVTRNRDEFMVRERATLIRMPPPPVHCVGVGHPKANVVLHPDLLPPPGRAVFVDNSLKEWDDVMRASDRVDFVLFEPK